MTRHRRRRRRAACFVLVSAFLVAGCGRSAAILPPAGSVSIAPTTPKPSVSAAPQVVAIGRFVGHATSGSWSYRVAFDGYAALSADKALVTGRMDVAGLDFATTIDYDFSKEHPDLGTIRTLVRAVEGKAWQRLGKGAWKAISSYDEKDSNAPFAMVMSIRDIRFLGTEMIDGKTVHRVAIADAVLIHPRTLPGTVLEERIRTTTLEVVVDGSGRPIRGAWTLEGQARVGQSGQLQQVVYNLTMAFSKVGAKLTIERP